MGANLSKKTSVLLILCVVVVPFAFLIWLFTASSQVEVPPESFTIQSLYCSKLFLSIIAAASLLFFIFRTKKK